MYFGLCEDEINGLLVLPDSLLLFITSQYSQLHLFLMVVLIILNHLV